MLSHKADIHAPAKEKRREEKKERGGEREREREIDRHTQRDNVCVFSLATSRRYFSWWPVIGKQ